MNRSRRKRIVWDLDDTLNNLMHEWLYSNGRPGKHLTYNYLTENPPHNILDISETTYKQSLDKFRVSEAARFLKPEPNLIKWFSDHGHNFENHILTARPPDTVAPAAEWVFKYFGKWIRNFHYIPAIRTETSLPYTRETKGLAIENMGGADYFVDDDLNNLESAAYIVPNRILFPQPWNSSKTNISTLLKSISQNSNIT